MRRVNVNLSDELYEKVQKRSFDTGASMSSIMALAYEQYEMQLSVASQLPNLLEAFKLQQEAEIKKSGS